MKTVLVWFTKGETSVPNWEIFLNGVLVGWLLADKWLNVFWPT